MSTPLPRFGLGFDSSPPSPSRTLRVPHSTELFHPTTTTKIHFNPSCGETRSFELSGKWMEEYTNLQNKDNDKAEHIRLSKRVTNLSKQTCEGLLTNYNIRYEVTSLINILNLGILYKSSDERTLRKSSNMNEEKYKEMINAGFVVDAVLGYKLEKVAMLLGVGKEKGKSFGNGAVKR